MTITRSDTSPLVGSVGRSSCRSSDAVPRRAPARPRPRAIAVVALLSAACATETPQHVSVAPAPAPTVASFVLADRSLVYGLTVATCNGRAMWTISNQKLGQPPDTINYGVTPPGFATRAGPTPLTPGCYEVTVSGPARTRFEIGADGRLIVKDSLSTPRAGANGNRP
jgi:hypothetical protein